MSVKKRVKAIDRFIAGCKTDGIYDDLNAACIMAGWDGLAGALTPLKGTAPTNSGFLDTDYDRGGIGIAGDETSYINSGFATNQLTAQDDFHLAIFPTTENSVATTTYHVIGSGGDVYLRDNVTNQAVRPNTTETPSSSGRAQAGKILAGSLFGTTLSYRINGVSQTTTGTAQAASGTTASVFGTAGLYVNESLAFYSFGSATDLALLDARVSTLMSDLRSIEESDFDADALTYIRAVEAADGSYLETDVKVAINKLVVGLKFDSLWDSIGTSCLLCGPRTIAGALVPLREYGPELWDDPNPSFIVNSDGSAGTWDAATNTMSNAAVSTLNTRPRFDWGTALPAGKTVRITGRFSGDVSHVYRIAAGAATVAYQNDINPDGSFAATVVPTSSALYIYIDGTLAPTSVTIESLSIREVIAAPTAEGGWASGDYDRATGLTGNPTVSLYLDSGRAGDDDPQNDRHRAAYVTVTPSLAAKAYMGHTNGTNQFDDIYHFTNGNSYVRSMTTGTAYPGTTEAGFIGYSRASSATADYEIFSVSAPGIAHPSTTPLTSNALVFGSNESGGPSRFTDATIAFYSIGTSLDIAKLGTHISSYVTAIGAAL